MRTMLWTAMAGGLSLLGCAGSSSSDAPFSSGGVAGAATGGAGPAGGTSTGGTGATGSGGLPPAAACPASANPCTPTELHSGQSPPATLDVSDGYLYWRTLGDYSGAGRADAASIYRVPVVGGTAEKLLGPLESLNTTAAGKDHVYFTSRTGVYRVPKAGGAPEELATGSAIMVVTDGVDVFASFSDAGILRVPTAGGEPVALTDAPGPYILALGPAHAYWTSSRSAAKHTLARVPKQGGTVQTLSEAIPALSMRHVIHGESVYAAIAQEISPRGLLLRIPVTGGAPTVVATYADEPLGGLSADAANLYFTLCSTTGGGSVVRFPVEGGAPVVITSTGDCLAGIAVDATRAYFADWGDETGEITTPKRLYSVDKCGCR